MTPKMNGIDKLTFNAKQVLSRSYQIAENSGSNEVNPQHLFYALIENRRGMASRLLSSVGIDLEKTKISLNITKKNFDTGVKPKEISVSPLVKKVLKNSFLIAHRFGHVYVGTEHILLAILKLQELDFVKEFREAGLNYENMKDKLMSYATYAPGIFMETNEEKENDKKALDYFGRNLNNLALKGKMMPIIGRDTEIQRIIHILSRQTKNNPILVGDAGVGKTAVVEGFVQRITKGIVPQSLKDIEVIQIDLASIIAGSRVRGDVEERLLALVSEVAADPNKVLFIDEIHMIVGAGAAGAGSSMDIANIIKPYLSDGSMRVIGATTNSEYQKYFEEDAALARRFQPIYIDEIKTEDAVKILKALKGHFEKFHKVEISDSALEDAVRLSARYITERFLPDKAIDVIDEAAATVKLKKEEKMPKVEEIKKKISEIKNQKDSLIAAGEFSKAADVRKEETKLRRSLNKYDNKSLLEKLNKTFVVDSEEVRKVIAAWKGIPVTTLSVSDIKSLKDIGKRLSIRIIGQNDAIIRVSSALKRARVGISDQNRPLASFLFLGPTGVGKTETAKVISKELFGSENSLIQVDMSEYMEQHSVAKIIGSPPGYVGYQEGGQLTEKVRRKPYSVILFDEIEKAHPEMINFLLQILEEGHLTDAKGRRVNFKNTIIILTSNIGAQEIREDSVLGFNVEKGGKRVGTEYAYERMQGRLIQELKGYLSPEFLNRIDEIVVYRGLSMKDAVKIAQLQISDLGLRISDQRIELKVTDKAVKFIAQQGFDDEYGARNIRRKIQELIENPISDLILEEKSATGLKVLVDEKDKKIVIRSI